MQWLIAVMGTGVLFTGAIVLLASAVVLRAASVRRSAHVSATALATVAAVAIASSATPLPSWFYVIWMMALVAWLFDQVIARRRPRPIAFIEMTLLAATVAALAMGLPFEWKPSITQRGLPRLYVVGDSITAGIGRQGEPTWPTILRDEHGVEVIDLSRAGAGAGEELRRIRGARSTVAWRASQSTVPGICNLPVMNGKGQLAFVDHWQQRWIGPPGNYKRVVGPPDEATALQVELGDKTGLLRSITWAGPADASGRFLLIAKTATGSKTLYIAKPHSSKTDQTLPAPCEHAS